MGLALTHQTPQEFAARFRAAYKNASAEKAAKMAHWLIERINAGDLTDAQVRNAFGLTVTQYTATKARFTALHDAYTAVQSAQGE